MKDGFVRAAVGTPAIRVADCPGNARNIIALMREAEEKHVKLLTLPELCVTGYTASDLLLTRPLLEGALSALEEICKASETLDVLTSVGVPLAFGGRLYNCAAFVKGGRVLGVMPKRCLPNYGVYYELRHFTPGPARVRPVELLGQTVPFGGELLLRCRQMPELTIGAEICEDLWVPDSPGVKLAVAGATVICNNSASDESVGKADYRRMLVTSQSARLICAYLYADAGEGESSTDLVFSGQNLIAENGALLAQSRRYTTGLVCAEIDVQFLDHERRRMNTFGTPDETPFTVEFDLQMEDTALTRFIDPMPFVPSDPAERAARCEEILDIQAHGLATRLKHIHCGKALVAVFNNGDNPAQMEFQLPVEASSATDLLADTVGAENVMVNLEWGKMRVQIPSNYATIFRLD